MRLYAVYLLLQTAVHVSGSDATHHQERIQLHLHYIHSIWYESYQML
jgi:hypothetical protein